MHDKILITGSTGLVGTNLLKKAREVYKDSKILSPKHDDFDLTNPVDCTEVTDGVDTVFHCAAASFGAMLMAKNPTLLLTPNVVMNAYMLEHSYRAGVKKFVWLASTTGYPYIAGQAMEESQMFEGDPYDKYFAVGWGKRFTEKMCELYSTKLATPMQCVVLRPTNIYGPHDKYDFDKCHVLPALIRRFMEKQDPLDVWGDGSETRDFIFVDDMVEAMLLAAEYPEFDQFNIGSGTQVSILEVIDLLSDITKHYPKLNFIGGKPSMIPSRDVNVRKAYDKLGFVARTSLREGLNKTIEWYKNEVALGML